MASPHTPAPTSLKRQRDSLKCDCCREKKRRCFPHDRDWSAGEKCEPCQLGGQDCGPDVRHPRNAGAGATLPHNSEPAPLFPRMPQTDPHPVSSNAGADQDLLFTNRVPTVEGSSATRLGSESQSQLADSRSVAESIVLPNFRLSTIDQRSEDCNDAPKCFTRLCELRIILEELRNLQSASLPPSDSRRATQIECGLIYTVSQTGRAFKKTLEKLLTIAANENARDAKLIYREAVEVIEAVDGDRGEFSILRANVLSRLTSIYEEEENWGAADWQLQKLATLQRHGRTGSVPDGSSKIAECSQKLSAKFGKVLDAINIAIEKPLHVDLETPFPPLHRALWRGLDEVTSILCRTPAALEGRDMRRQNAVMVAAAIGKVHLLEPAFRSNPDLLTDRDALHRHALFYAAHNGDYESFLTLVRAGANFTDRDASGRSILRVAAVSGSARIVEYLLLHGISPNDDVLRGSSALHDAAKTGRWTICKLLLSKGALANDRLPADGVSGEYKTPSEVAKDNSFPDIASMIEKAASRPINDTTHPMNDTTHPMNHITHPMNNTTHPINNTTHPMNSTTNPINNTTHPMNSTTHLINNTTHPMNSAAHPMNDIVHQEYGQTREPQHVADIQSTHTASATHTDDESADAPILWTQLHPNIHQIPQVDQRTPSDHDDWFDDSLLDDIVFPLPMPDSTDGIFDHDYASPLPVNASVHAPVQNYEASQ